MDKTTTPPTVTASEVFYDVMRLFLFIVGFTLGVRGPWWTVFVASLFFWVHFELALPSNTWRQHKLAVVGGLLLLCVVNAIFTSALEVYVPIFRKSIPIMDYVIRDGIAILLSFVYGILYMVYEVNTEQKE